MNRTLTHICKAIIVAACLGAVWALLIHLNETRSEFLIENAKSILGWILNPLSFLMASLGLTGETWAQALQEKAYGDWLPLSAGSGICVKITTLLLIPLGGRSTIDRIWPNLPDILDRQVSTATNTKDGENSLLPRAKGQAFYGREQELHRLETFAKNNDPACGVFGIEGAEGMGKSRLAHEWLLQLQKQRQPFWKLRRQKWDVGYLLPNVTAETVRRAHFRRPTAIVIDEIERAFNKYEDLWNLLAAFETKAKKRPIRIIIADQALERPYNDIDAALKKTISNIWRETSLLRLYGLIESEARKLNSDLVSPEDNETGYRPLFLRIGVKGTSDISRRAARRLTLAENIGAGAERSLILGALAGPISWHDLETYIKTSDTQTLGSFNKKWRKLRPLFEGTSKDVLKYTLPNLTTNAIADQVILQWADDNPDTELNKYVDLAAHLNPAAVARRIMSLWSRSLSNEEQQIVQNMESRLDQANPDWIAALHRETDNLVGQSYNAIKEMDKHALQTALSRLIRLADYRPLDQVLQRDKVKGAVNAIHYYGEAKDFDALERWGEHLIKTAERFPDNQDIQLQKASGAVNAMFYYDEAKDFDTLERWGERLIKTAERFPDNQDIQLEKPKGAINAMNHYGQAKDFDALERWGERLIKTVERFPNNPDIQLQKAKGAVNALIEYGNAGQQGTERYSVWKTRLANVAMAFPSHPEIQHQAGRYNLTAAQQVLSP